MGVITYDMVLNTYSISSTRMFQAFVLDAHNLIPIILPQAIQSVQILYGDGGPGSIKLITFGEDSQLTYEKQRVDAISTEDLTYKYSIIEGDALIRGLRQISYVIRMEESDIGGCICTIRSTYYTQDGDVQITEEQITRFKHEAMAIFYAVESYLQENPDAYD